MEPKLSRTKQCIVCSSFNDLHEEYMMCNVYNCVKCMGCLWFIVHWVRVGSSFTNTALGLSMLCCLRWIH